MAQNSVIDLPKICIVIPYFGQWPVWMPFFVESCRANPTINWLLFTDCGLLPDCPENIELRQIAYPEYCQLVSNKLGVSFHPENAYKLCDIKPALGFIHAEELMGFDFWGFGDIDLVYGNLRQYFTPTRLAKKDLFSTHARRISGHLCLIRNTEELQTAFKRVKDWARLMTIPQHIAFDEKAFSKIFLRHKNSPRWVGKMAALFDLWLQRAEFVEAYTTPYANIKWLDGSLHYPSEWKWQGGILTNDISGNLEFPYFHFMVWKKHWVKKDSMLQLENISRTSAFTISSLGFKAL